MNLNEVEFLNFGENFREDMIRKKLANELKPEMIKQSIILVDKAYSQLLTATILALSTIKESYTTGLILLSK